MADDGERRVTLLAGARYSSCASACEKSVALVTDMLGPMGRPCPVCRGGWWYEDGCLVAGVHVTDCPRADEEPSL